MTVHEVKRYERELVVSSSSVKGIRNGSRLTTATKDTIGLVLADRYPIFLQGMDEMFRRECDFRVFACCTSVEQAMSAVDAHRPEILLIDLRMPGKSGIVIACEIRQNGWHTSVVLLADTVDEDELLEAVRAGVKGVILKDMPSRLVVQCVRKVYAGETWIEKQSMGRAMEKMLRRETSTREMSHLLTPREVDVFHLVVTGLSNKEIAERLRISAGTIKIHLHNVYEKLHVRGRLGLALHARDKGLL